MAKKKPPTIQAEKPKPPKRNTDPSSFRLTPECHELLEWLSANYQMTRTAAIEMSTRFLVEHLRKAEPAHATQVAAESARKPK